MLKAHLVLLLFSDKKNIEKNLTKSNKKIFFYTPSPIFRIHTYTQVVLEYIHIETHICLEQFSCRGLGHIQAL